MTIKVNIEVVKQITEIIEKYGAAKGIEHRKGESLSERFVKILQKMKDREEEKEFLKEISRVYNIKLLEESEYEVARVLNDIDIDKVKAMGIHKIREKMFIPLKKAIVTVNPFLDIYHTTLLLCSTSMFTQVVTKIQENLGIQKIEVDDTEQFLREVLEYAYVKNVSDVHIEYDSVTERTVIRMRKDGVLYNYREIPSAYFHELLSNKIFELSNINSNDFLRIHDQRFIYEIYNRHIPIRVSIVPVLTNSRDREVSSKLPSFVLRFLTMTEKTEKARDGIKTEEKFFSEMGFEKDAVDVFKSILQLPAGLVIFCGPTGSGKTTTLYAFLQLKKQEKVKILTIEDPVEATISGVTQVEVKEENNITFSSAVRAFLRQDPDVILIGEIRDKETAVEALRASITGHLVFSTLHTSTTHGVITRLVDLGVEKFLLAEALKYVVSQRLVRKLCNECKIKVDITSEKNLKKFFGISKKDFEESYPFFAERGITHLFVNNIKGCNRCEEGYTGRTVIYEILKIREELMRKIAEGLYIAQGDVFKKNEKFTLVESALRKIEAGITSIREVERYIVLNQKNRN